MITFFSSPIGLGHITRDIAIAQRMLEFTTTTQIEFATGSRAFQFIEDVTKQGPFKVLNKSNLYVPPQFSVKNGELKQNFWWLISYLKYFKKSKTAASKFLLSCHEIHDENSVLVSDEDFAALSVSREMNLSSILITDILQTKFIKNRFLSLLEVSLNKSMKRLISYSNCVIVPETGDNIDNFFYVGPIVRNIAITRDLLREKLGLNKKTILITTGGTDSGCYLTKKTIKALSGLRHKFDFDLLVSYPSTLELSEGNLPWYKSIGILTNLHEYIYASDLVISLAGKSTIDECLAYGTPGIFIPIRNHFEQEERAKILGFSANDVHNLESILVERLSNLGSRMQRSSFDGDIRAAKLILSYSNK